MSEEFVIEANDPLEKPESGNVSPEPVPEVVEQPVEPEQPKEESQPVTEEEPTIELEGQRLTASQIREMKEAYDNKEKWQKSNTQKAQEIAIERKRLARLELLEEQINKRPDILQEMFKPQPTRNVDTELQSLYQSKPQDIFSPEYQQWEYNKDRLLLEKAESSAEQRVTQRITEREAYDHNTKLGAEIEVKMRSKGRSEDEILAMGQWVADNIKPKNGKFDSSSFEIAESVLYGKEAVRQAKLDTAKTVAQSITMAKPASEVSAIQKPHESRTQSDLEDDDFITQVNERFRG